MLLKIALILAGWFVGALALGILVGKRIAYRCLDFAYLNSPEPDENAELVRLQSEALESLAQAVTANSGTQPSHVSSPVGTQVRLTESISSGIYD